MAVVSDEPRERSTQKFVCRSEAAEWVRDSLGLDPSMVSRVVITLEASQVATIEITRFVTPAELARLKLGKLWEERMPVAGSLLEAVPDE